MNHYSSLRGGVPSGAAGRSSGRSPLGHPAPRDRRGEAISKNRDCHASLREARNDGSVKWLHYFAVLLSIVTFVLIIAGGLVTSTGSGLAVPDWPLSYGQWFPPMVGGIFFEHGHRMVAAAVGFCTLIFTVALCLQESRRWVRWLAIAALGIVVGQGILGGMTVLHLLPATLSVTHAVLAQTFFCVTVCLALATAPSWSHMTIHVDCASYGRLAVMTMIFVYAQLITGAIVRHAHMGVPLHVILGLLVVLHVLLLVWRIVTAEDAPSQLGASGAVPASGWRVAPVPLAGGDPPVGPAKGRPLIADTSRGHVGTLAVALALCVILQLFLGIGAFISTHMLGQHDPPPAFEIGFTTAHQALGALILAMSVIIAVWSYARSQQRAEVSVQ